MHPLIRISRSPLFLVANLSLSLSLPLLSLSLSLGPGLQPPSSVSHSLVPLISPAIQHFTVGDTIFHSPTFICLYASVLLLPHTLLSFSFHVFFYFNVTLRWHHKHFTPLYANTDIEILTLYVAYFPNMCIIRLLGKPSNKSWCECK